MFTRGHCRYPDTVELEDNITEGMEYIVS